MCGLDHATILIPSFHCLREEHLAQWSRSPIWVLNTTKIPGAYFQKYWVGVCGTLPETLTLLQTKICDFPYLFQTWSKIWYPILDLKPWRVNGARDTLLWHVHDSWRKHQMVLSSNYEEVANSSKKNTQFKTRVHKPYPISDQNGRNWNPISDQNGYKKHTLLRGTYLYSLYKGLPPPPTRAKNALQIKIVEVSNSANRLLSDFSVCCHP